MHVCCRGGASEASEATLTDCSAGNFDGTCVKPRGYALEARAKQVVLEATRMRRNFAAVLQFDTEDCRLVVASTESKMLIRTSLFIDLNKQFYSSNWPITTICICNLTTNLQSSVSCKVCDCVGCSFLPLLLPWILQLLSVEKWIRRQQNKVEGSHGQEKREE